MTNCTPRNKAVFPISFITKIPASDKTSGAGCFFKGRPFKKAWLIYGVIFVIHTKKNRFGADRKAYKYKTPRFLRSHAMQTDKSISPTNTIK